MGSKEARALLVGERGPSRRTAAQEFSIYAAGPQCTMLHARCTGSGAAIDAARNSTLVGVEDFSQGY